MQLVSVKTAQEKTCLAGAMNSIYETHCFFQNATKLLKNFFVKERHLATMHFGRRETPLGALTLLRGAQQTKPLTFTT